MTKELIHLFFKENFSFSRFLGFNYKKEKGKAILIIAAIIYALVAFGGSFGYMFFDLGKYLSQINQTHIILSFITVYAIGMAIMFVLFRADGMIFHTKDYEILAPLPIPSKTILFAKLAVLYVMTTSFSVIISLPMAFGYFYWYGFSILGFIFYLLGLLLIPLVPMVLMSFVSLLIASISKKFRASKIVSIILLFAFFIGIFVMSFSMSDVEQNPLTGQIDLLSGISKYYIPIKWYMNAVHDHQVLDFLYLLGSHLVIFGLYFYLIGPLVHKTNQNQTKMKAYRSKKVLTYETQSIYKTLINKEFKKFFGITIYAVNAGLGPVLLTILSLASLFYQDKIGDFLAQMVGVGLDIEVMVLLIVGFSVAMTYTPSITLSLEGKNFWIIKSLPIKSETIMLSKVFFNLLLILPIALISILMLGFSLKIPALSQIIMMGLVTAFAFLMSFLDAVFNLYIPKFDFKNDVEIVKQSASAMLGIFGGFAMLALNGVIYYFARDILDLNIMLFILLILNSLLAFLCYIWMMRISSPLIEKMQA